jgi:hypothetical protein
MREERAGGKSRHALTLLQILADGISYFLGKRDWSSLVEDWGRLAWTAFWRTDATDQDVGMDDGHEGNVDRDQAGVGVLKVSCSNHTRDPWLTNLQRPMSEPLCPIRDKSEFDLVTTTGTPISSGCTTDSFTVLITSLGSTTRPRRSLRIALPRTEPGGS